MKRKVRLDYVSPFCTPCPDDLLVSASALRVGFCLGPPTDEFMSSLMPTRCPVSSLAPPLHHSLKAPPFLASAGFFCLMAPWPSAASSLGHRACAKALPTPWKALPGLSLWPCGPQHTEVSLLSSLPPSSLELSHPSSVLSLLTWGGAFTALPYPAANLVIFNGKLIMYEGGTHESV